MQSFLESTKGQILIGAVILVIFLAILIIGNKKAGKKVDAKAMSVSALLVAIAYVLSMVTIWRMPQGGSVTLLSTLPIALCAYFFGTTKGVMAGVALGFLNLMLGPYVIHPAQMLLDYPLAFGAMGLGGFFRNQKHGLTKVYLFGLLARYVCAVLSGIIFFGSYAPENFNAVTWSLFYNMTYLAVEGAICVVLMNVPAVRKAFERLRTQVDAPLTVPAQSVTEDVK